LRELNKRSDSLLIVENSGAFRDEVHLSELLPVRDNGFSGLVNPAIHAHDKLMLEPCVRVLKEGIKVVFEGLEK